MAYPALKPPVKAPWRRFLPLSSVTSCFQIGTYDPSSRASGFTGGRGVPKATKGLCCFKSASYIARVRLLDIFRCPVEHKAESYTFADTVNTLIRVARRNAPFNSPLRCKVNLPVDLNMGNSLLRLNATTTSCHASQLSAREVLNGRLRR